MSPPNGPSEPQREASDPYVSAWVTANAGSGKTKVLIDRVARLLLGTGKGPPPDPSRILCLTFTRAAAATMQNKLFERLGDWALMSDDDLRKQMHELHGDKYAELSEKIELKRARRLFAQALETPGGLRIQTIHAFCESLLRRFPWEAGVSPDFALIEDFDAEALRHEARDAVFDDAFADVDGNREADPLFAATKRVLADAQESGLSPLIGEILAQRHVFETDEETFLAASAEQLGIEPETSAQDVIDVFHRALPNDAVRQLANAALNGTKTDQERGDALLQALGDDDDEDIREALRSMLLTNEGTIRKRLLTKGAIQSDPDAFDIAEKGAELLVQLRTELATITALERTRALFRFAQRFLARHAEIKSASNSLNFNDLIDYAAALLSRSEARAWVRYKLDGGVDHILVDEAQDTSPEQWQIITAIAEEFFAGQSAREIDRTVFVVGDEKQSIFSFQGARPEQLASIRQSLGKMVEDGDRKMRSPQLLHSFRSAPTILSSVDAIFEEPHMHDGLSTEGEPPRHIAYRDQAPGRVELWPLLTAAADPEPLPWHVPVDTIPPSAPHNRLAAGIGEQIARWLKDKTVLPARGRPIKAGDILILVRRRGDIVDALLRELKRRNVPVAGRDRLKLTDELVVQDMLALAQFALLPQDDLNLATVLRSPIIGLSEDALFELAHNRGEMTLWQALSQNKDAAFSEANRLLHSILGTADFLPPFEFFQHALIDLGARQRILDRLGNQAADPLDVFLETALTGSIESTRSLQAFVHSMERSDLEMKRQMEQGRDEVRIMTVHGAKGLEAPIVIMPDLCGTPKVDQKRLFTFDGGGAVWTAVGDTPSLAVQTMKDEKKQRDDEEHRRLLYVGLTRAEDWLILCGWRGKNEPNEKCWAKRIEPYFATAKTFDTPLRGEDGARLQGQFFENDGVAKHDSEEGEILVEPAPLPDALLAPKSESSKPQPLAPSKLTENEPFVPMPPGGGSEDGAISSAARGTEIHELIELIAETPPERRAALAQMQSDQSGEAKFEAALRVVEHPEFAWMFGPNSLAEIPLLGPVAALNGRTVRGAIDRLVIGEAQIDVIDFKTGRHAPGAPIPESYLRQLALYRAAVREIYPNRAVKCHLVWVDMLAHDEISVETLDVAFGRISAHIKTTH